MATPRRTEIDSDWLDLRQAVAAFPLSRRILWRWISAGRLACYRPFEGRKVLVKRSDSEAILEGARDAQSPARTARSRHDGSTTQS